MPGAMWSHFGRCSACAVAEDVLERALRCLEEADTSFFAEARRAWPRVAIAQTMTKASGSLRLSPSGGDVGTEPWIGIRVREQGTGTTGVVRGQGPDLQQLQADRAGVGIDQFDYIYRDS